MKPILSITIIIILILTAFNCDDSTVNPKPEQPGRRDYMWTVDTIRFPYGGTLFRLWASSPADVWATANGADVTISFFHFNGVKWSSGGVPGMDVPHSIYGFSNDNVYIGTAGSGIWQFKGSNWFQVAKLTKDGHSDIVFDNMWGYNPNDIYAFGAYPDENGYANNSVIAHFFYGKWEMLDTDGLYGIVEHLYKNSEDGKIYLQVIGGHNYTDSTFIYEYNQGQYYKLYSNIWTQGLQADISLINGEVYFVLGNEIAKRINNKFQTYLKVDNPNFYQRIWGRNSKDIFLLMVDGLAHYNGNDIEYLFYFNKVPRTQIYGAALFDNDIFFLVSESQTGLNLIYHGKLK